MNLNKFKNLPSPYILILIGPPMSGKGFFCKQFLSEIDENVTIINRDETLMEVYGSRDYNKAFDNVNHGIVDKVVKKKIVDANKEKKNVIIDMTHMSSKRRRTNLDYFSDDYYKLGVIFPILSDEEYARRNKIRIEEENKDISMGIVKNMISNYQTIRNEEGFDKVISL